VDAYVNHNVQDITCGTLYSLVLINNKVYGCGSNENGELGLGDDINKLVWTELTSLTNPISEIHAGGFHSIFVI